MCECMSWVIIRHIPANHSFCVTALVPQCPACLRSPASALVECFSIHCASVNLWSWLRKELLSVGSIACLWFLGKYWADLYVLKTFYLTNIFKECRTTKHGKTGIYLVCYSLAPCSSTTAGLIPCLQNAGVLEQITSKMGILICAVYHETEELGGGKGRFLVMFCIPLSLATGGIHPLMLLMGFWLFLLYFSF